MKPVKIHSTIPFWFLAVIIISRPAGGAEPAKAPPAKLEPIKSVFVMPTNPKEGRDPFFPESTRVYEVNAAVAAATTAHVVEITTLKIKGYSLVNGQPMVIINNHAFMPNDEGDVLTSGGRVHIRCLNIKPGDVTIEANGQVQKLHF